MAKNKVEVEMTVAQAQAVNAWLSSQKSMQSYMDSMGKSTRKQQTLSSRLNEEIGNWPKSIASAAMGWASFAAAAAGARTVIQAVSNEIDRMARRQESAIQGAADYQVQLSKLGNILPRTSDMTLSEIDREIRQAGGGVDPAVVARGIQASVSAGLTLPVSERVGIATAIARTAPELGRDQDEFDAVIEGVQELLQRAPQRFRSTETDPAARLQQQVEMALGTTFGAQSAARVTNTGMVSRNIIGAAVRLGARPGVDVDVEQGIELLSAISSRSVDPTGEVSRTAAINFVGQLQDELAAAGKVDLADSGDIVKMLRFVQSGDAKASGVRERLLGQLVGKDEEEIEALQRGGLSEGDIKGRLRTRATTATALRELLAQGDTETKKLFEQAQGDITVGREALEDFERNREMKQQTETLRSMEEVVTTREIRKERELSPRELMGGALRERMAEARVVTDVNPVTPTGLLRLIDREMTSLAGRLAMSMASTEEQQRAVATNTVERLERIRGGGFSSAPAGVLQGTMLLPSIIDRLIQSNREPTEVEQEQLNELRKLRESMESQRDVPRRQAHHMLPDGMAGPREALQP